MPSYTVATEKKGYQRNFQDLCDQFIKKTNGSQFLKKHTEIVDNLLIKLWIDSNVSKKIRSLPLAGMAGMSYFPIQMLTYWCLIAKKV
jgi:hypothetical protein